MIRSIGWGKAQSSGAGRGSDALPRRRLSSSEQGDAAHAHAIRHGPTWSDSGPLLDLAWRWKHMENMGPTDENY